MRFPSAIGVSTFARGRIELLDVRIPAESRLEGLAVCEVNPLLRTNVLLCMVRRGDTTYIPKGDFILHAGDDITVIIPPKEQKFFFDQIGVPSMPIKNAMLVGGGKIAFFLAKILLDAGLSVKIIENSLERCEFLSEKLPAATVIHGDGTDRELLDEEGLSSCGAFASLTGMDEENILLSLHAGRHSKARLFTKVNRVNFEEVISHLPIGTIVRPKQTTAELIGQYTRAMQNSMGSNIETLHQLGGAEALEFRVAAHHLTGVPLQDMPIRPDVLLCCINRKGRRIIPARPRRASGGRYRYRCIHPSGHERPSRYFPAVGGTINEFCHRSIPHRLDAGHRVGLSALSGADRRYLRREGAPRLPDCGGGFSCRCGAPVPQKAEKHPLLRPRGAT